MWLRDIIPKVSYVDTITSYPHVWKSIVQILTRIPVEIRKSSEVLEPHSLGKVEEHLQAVYATIISEIPHTHLLNETATDKALPCSYQQYKPTH